MWCQVSSFFSGFVAVAGRPNVGKSTLLNRVIGQKVSIVSAKPQTTRNQVQCVLTRADFQMIFLDTPGIHKPRHKLGDYMVKTALAAWEGADGILFVVDGAAGIGGGDEFIAARLAQVETPVVLAVNKVDRLDENGIAAALSKAGELGRFHAILPVAAAIGYNVDKLVKVLRQLLPEGPRYFPDDMVSDHPEQFIVAELVREQVLRCTGEEVPHSVAVQVESLDYRAEQNLTHAYAVIYVERESQKGILIGKGGSMLQKVGSAARREIEALLGTQVFLQLHVKVREGWRNRAGALREFGYTE